MRSVAFFIYGGLVTGYWLLIASIPMVWWLWIVAAIGGCALCGLCGWVLSRYLPWPRMISSKKPRYLGLRWLLAFTIPIPIITAITSIIPTYMEKIYVVMWYPYLGMSLLLASILIEKPITKLNPELVRSRPFLITGSTLLILTPIPIITTLIVDEFSGWLIALGLMIMTYTITGILVLRIALRVFEE